MNADHVRELAESIKELRLLNPVAVDKDHILIAGLHHLEAVKLMEWSEVECTVSSLEGLRAELAEIDENIVRNDFTAIEYGEMLLRRKEIYETLHPETKEIIKDTDTKISKKAALKLSRLKPEQQEEAAALLAAKEIKSVDEYKAAKAAEPVPEPVRTKKGRAGADTAGGTETGAGKARPGSRCSLRAARGTLLHLKGIHSGLKRPG